MLRYRSVDVSVEDDSAVGRMPAIVQGWRPTSATTQPNSAASQGSGIAQTAQRRNQRRLACCSSRRAHSQNAVTKVARNRKPRPTMMRNEKNTGATGGIVFFAAA